MLYLLLKFVYSPLEDGRKDGRSEIGSHDTYGDVKKKSKLLDWEYAAVERETVGQINQHQKTVFNLVPAREDSHGNLDG